MSKKRFLVVDDEPDIRDVISVALSIQGYHVESAANRDAALRMISKNGPPDVIFLDYFMPGLTIEEFLHALKTLAPKVKVVLVTAANDPARTAKDLELDEFIAKPFSLYDLYRITQNERYARN
jgi:two-component system, OmpR family, phosphate regulon response regulator PhoB